MTDDQIRDVIEAWVRTGELTERDGSISPYVCERVRAEMLRDPAARSETSRG